MLDISKPGKLYLRRQSSQKTIANYNVRIDFRHPHGSSFVRLEKVRTCNVSFISALTNKYGLEYTDPNMEKDIEEFKETCKMSTFTLVGMEEILKQQGLVYTNYFIFLLVS